MAVDFGNYASTNVTAKIIDYTAPTPLEVDLTTMEGEIEWPVSRPLDVVDIFTNTTGGKEHTGTAVNGRGAPPTFTITLVAVDIADNAEVTAPVGCLLALEKNSVAGTAFSSHVYTSQLSLGGKLQAKLAVVLTNATGATATLTIPFRVDTVTLPPAGGKYNCVANCTVVGAITRT